MNSAQAASLVRMILNFLSGAMLAWSASHTKPAQDLAAYVVQFINGPDMLALATAGVMWLWGHLTHSSPSSPSSPPANKPNLSALVAIGAAAVLFTGCHSTPQQVSYKAVGATDVTVQAALATYDQFAAAGKTTPAENSAVKAAFEKYQHAFAVVCDAGAIYAATSGTNAPAASLALQTAIVNANQSITDLLAIVQNTNHKLK